MYTQVSKPKVSVIIPAYNSDRFIRETIDSVLNQTYRDFELIVVDDGSSDRTADIISSYKDRLIYIRKENEGISTARNRGIEIARGEYLAFIDHDDIWFPEFLEEVVAELDKNKEARLCFANTYVMDGEKKRTRTLFDICPPHKGMVFEKLVKGNFIPVITTVIRREVFEEVGLFDPRYRIAEDWDIFLKISKRYPITFIDRPLAEYRIHEASFSRQRDLMLTEFIDIIGKYISSVDKRTSRVLETIRRRAQFDLGIVYLNKSSRSKSREYFLNSLKADPLSLYFYIGLIINYLPNRLIEFIWRILPSKGLHGLESRQRPLSV